MCQWTSPPLKCPKRFFACKFCLNSPSSPGKSAGGVLPRRHLQHCSWELFQHHRHVHRRLCHLPDGVFCRVCTQNSAGLPLYLFTPGESAPKFLKFVDCIYLTLFRVSLGWIQMLDCPSLVSTMEMNFTSCKSSPKWVPIKTIPNRWEPIYEASRDLKAADSEMSQLIIQLWTSFIKTGVPTSRCKTYFPPFWGSIT